MTRDVIEKARVGVVSKRYSLTELARASDIPLTTLATMLEEKWGGRVFDAIDRLERLKVGMKVIDCQKERAG
jgi:hypothetical protein